MIGRCGSGCWALSVVGVGRYLRGLADDESSGLEELQSIDVWYRVLPTLIDQKTLERGPGR